MAASTTLTADHVLEFPFSRSVGPVIGAFLTGLRDGKLVGVRTPTSGVVVPPTEYDPATGEDVGEFVDVGPAGTIESLTWVTKPGPKQPLDRPFAYALIKLDGADTSMLHVVDAGSPDAVSTGDRVVPRWKHADDRIGHVLDIEAFVPESSAPPAAEPASAEEPVSILDTPTRLDFLFTPGQATSRFLTGLSKGHFVGQRCPTCHKVYIPSRGSCPVDGVPMTEDVDLPDTGIVTTYCVVNVPFAGQSIEIPYICAQILLDGANISFMGLIQGMPADQVRMGLRVKAIWVAPEELGPSLASVKHFEPTGEPDADYETFKEYL